MLNRQQPAEIPAEQRYRIVFKEGRDLPWYEPIDPTFTYDDFSDEYFRRFFEGGYINRSAIIRAREQFEREDFQFPPLATLPPLFQRRIYDHFFKRGIALPVPRRKGACA